MSRTQINILCALGGDRVQGGAGEETESGRTGSAGPGERPGVPGADQRDGREDEGRGDPAEE